MSSVTVKCNVDTLRHTRQNCSEASWSCNVDEYHPLLSAWFRAMEKASRQRFGPVTKWSTQKLEVLSAVRIMKYSVSKKLYLEEGCRRRHNDVDQRLFF